MATAYTPVEAAGKKTVATPSGEVTAQTQAWALPDTLMGGTLAMRAAGEKYLPKWPNEGVEAYRRRCAVSVLFPAFQHTVETLAAKPFSQPVTLEEVPGRLEEWLEDVDLEGNNVAAFGFEMLKAMFAPGLVGLLVEHPPADPNIRTQADEAKAKVRPYFVRIHARQLLGWESKVVDGQHQLTMLRFAECVKEKDGEWDTKDVDQVRVLRPGAWEVYRKPAGAEDWALYDAGTTSLKYIPFFPAYGERLGFMTAKSPLLELAFLNCKHWQEQSDQDNILHVARVPILVRTGVDETVDANGQLQKKPLTVGSQSLVDLPKDATLTYTEHTGTGIAAGKAALDDLKEEMRQVGAEMLVMKPGSQTRIADAVDQTKSMCTLQRMTLHLQSVLQNGLRAMADYVGEAETGALKLFTDFGATTLAEAAATFLVSFQTSGIISKRTALAEAQRRSLLNPAIDYDEEQERIAEEGPALGSLGVDPITGLPKEPAAPAPGPTPAPTPKPKK